MSNAMHETISRFYENLIGRSEAFIHFVYPKLLEISGNLSDVSERELYEAVNIARPSLIRTEADELTYSLHILIRYELEKAFINGDITVDKIPALWNAKYKEYLGIDVPNDSAAAFRTSTGRACSATSHPTRSATPTACRSCVRCRRTSTCSPPSSAAS